MRWMMLLIMCVTAAGCSAKEDERTKYPGELGAYCASQADCDAPLRCTSDLYPPDAGYLTFCYKECATDDDCGADGLCELTWVQPNAQARICVRRCPDTAFCEDLNADTNECASWGEGGAQLISPGVPGKPERPYCGFGG